MDTLHRKSDTINSRHILLPYALAVVAAMVVIQVVTVLTGGRITVIIGVLTAVVAVGIAVWYWSNQRTLKRVRFGGAIAHAIAFVAVTTSFNLHAALRALFMGDSGQGTADVFFTTPWFGATLVMSGLWGIGLLVHLIGAVLGRGWED